MGPSLTALSIQCLGGRSFSVSWRANATFGACVCVCIIHVPQQVDQLRLPGWGLEGLLVV